MQMLGDRIRTRRKEYGMSQAELARRSGLSKTSMNQIEQGTTVDPRLSHIIAIAKALRISLDTLAGQEDTSVAEADTTLAAGVGLGPGEG